MLTLPLSNIVQDYLNKVILETITKAQVLTGWDFFGITKDMQLKVKPGVGDFHILSVTCSTTNQLGEEIKLYSRAILSNKSLLVVRDDGEILDLLGRASEDAAFGLAKEILKAKGFDFEDEYKRHMENKNNHQRQQDPFYIPLVVDPNIPKDEIHLRSGNNVTKIKLGPKPIYRNPKWK